MTPLGEIHQHEDGERAVRTFVRVRSKTHYARASPGRPRPTAEMSVETGSNHYDVAGLVAGQSREPPAQGGWRSSMTSIIHIQLDLVTYG